MMVNFRMEGQCATYLVKHKLKSNLMKWLHWKNLKLLSSPDSQWESLGKLTELGKAWDERQSLLPKHDHLLFNLQKNALLSTQLSPLKSYLPNNLNGSKQVS